MTAYRYHCSNTQAQKVTISILTYYYVNNTKIWKLKKKNNYDPPSMSIDLIYSRQYVSAMIANHLILKWLPLPQIYLRKT